MWHCNHPVADLEPARLRGIDDDADRLMPQFAAQIAIPPGLPLGAHRCHQDLYLDDIARRLRLRPFSDPGRARAGDLSCQNFRLLRIAGRSCAANAR